MSKYLDAAYEVVKRIEDNNESAAHTMDSERRWCVQAYALLAAIDKGILPESVAAEMHRRLHK